MDDPSVREVIQNAVSSAVSEALSGGLGQPTSCTQSTNATNSGRSSSTITNRRRGPSKLLPSTFLRKKKNYIRRRTKKQKLKYGQRI